jgi:GntR family transcriptional regulator, transcriptional repressor for pyruvate dehydrogenase complex
MVLSPVKRVRLVESVTGRVLAMLQNGGYRPGTKLPSEREFCAQLVVGRSSIREALQALIGMGIIEAQAGRGYYVRAVAGENAVRAQMTAALANGQSLVELLEARLILEPEIAALAAKHATTADFAVLDRALLRIVAAARHGRIVYRAAALFHVDFAKAGHNTPLTQMVRSLVSVMSYWGRVFEWTPGRAQQEVRLHRDLLECLKRRNPRAMRRKMREHILVTHSALQFYLQKARDRGIARNAARQ